MLIICVMEMKDISNINILQARLRVILKNIFNLFNI